MPRPLPVKLQLRILGHLEWDIWEADDRSRTLASCCLVCRAWCLMCQRELLSVTTIWTRRQLRRLMAILSSETCSIGAYITQLSLVADSDAEDKSFHHMALFYLPTKLPSVRCLILHGTYIPVSLNRSSVYPLYLDHPSIPMHLKHFTTVTELHLSDIAFQSFWEFRRLVVALPALSSLYISAIDVVGDPDPFQKSDRRVPSLFSVPWNLVHLSLAVSTAWNPLWLWVSPLQPRY